MKYDGMEGEDVIRLIREALMALGLTDSIMPEKTDFNAVPIHDSFDDATVAHAFRLAQAHRMVREAAAYWSAQGDCAEFVIELERVLNEVAVDGLIMAVGGTPRFLDGG